jgi:hypothetical protein
MKYRISVGSCLMQMFGSNNQIDRSQIVSIDDPSNISFSTVMFGGYDSAKFDIPLDHMWASMSSVLFGSDIRIYDDHGVQVWEGFANKVSISSGASLISIGPLMEISNRINLRYTTYRWNTNPPTGGDEEETGFIIGTEEAKASLNTWGSLSEIISAPREMSTDEALEAVMGILRTKPNPKYEFSISDSNGQESITIECLGYFHLLNKMISDYYNNADIRPANEVISHPFSHAGIFFDMSGVEPVGYELALYNAEIETSFDFIESAYEHVNALSDYGFTLGVYNNRTVYFSEIKRPDWPSVFVSASTGELAQGFGIPRPSYVVPGMWAQAVDFPTYISAAKQEPFIVSGIEVAGDRASINASTFSALDKILGERGL